MYRNVPKTTPQPHALRRAASQFGAIRTDQLSACGLSKDQLAVMVRDGLLRRRLRGIYVSPTVPDTLAVHSAAVSPTSRQPPSGSGSRDAVTRCAP